MEGCEKWTFKVSRCFDHKPIPDLSGRRVIDTSNPVKRAGIPPVLTRQVFPCVLTSPHVLIFLLGCSIPLLQAASRLCTDFERDRFVYLTNPSSLSKKDTSCRYTGL